MTLTPVWLVLSFLLVTAAAVKDTYESVKLRAIKPKNVNSDSPSLNIVCDFDRNKAKLVSVSELAMYRFDIGGGGKQEMMAEITTGHLTYGLSESEISGSGIIRNEDKSRYMLSVTYASNTDGYCHSYSCKATGLRENGEELSLTRSIKVKGVNGSLCKSKGPANVPVTKLQEKIEECCVSSEAVQAHTKAIDSLEKGVSKCSAVIPDVENNEIEIEDLREQISDLSVALSSIQKKQAADGGSDLQEKKLGNLTGRVENLERASIGLEQAIRIFLKLFSINKNYFDVSSVYKGNVYAVGKQEGIFSLASLSSKCKNTGGHIVEFDNKDEQMFVTFFLKTTGQHVYYLGASDSASEGNFVYYYSHRPVKNVIWEGGKLTNQGPLKNCLSIEPNGISNIACNQPSKAVCEIPLM
ncbi:leca_4 protein [Plakobranchus ocellatus]|uniref:Leca_4 protein n=1 Tax=Plakobranchus ocellatus TaxID=259542 RepID=A0AAV4CC82_9GAST|nr:leca_4 protein [Plakobranchus ocellatus]